MITSLKNCLAIAALCLLAASAAFGQSAAPELNITLSEQRVRFAPTRSFQEMRLEVFNSVGEIIFSHLTAEAEFDWNLRAGNNEALAPGLYRYALTLKFGEDQLRHHTGHFVVEKGQDQIWLTASNGAEVSGTTMSAARTSGRSIAGIVSKGDKSVRRDMSGREVVDETGNKPSSDKYSTTALKQEKPALFGTANRVAKFDASGSPNNVIDSAITEVGGNVGIGTTNPQAALHIFSTAINPLRMQMSGVPRAALSALMENYGGGVSGGSGLVGRAANGSIAAPTNVAPGDRLGFSMFGGYAGGAFRNTAAINGLVGTGTVSATSLPTYLNFMTTPNGSVFPTERVRIDQDGNVGINTTAPGAKLHIVGDIRSSALRQEVIANAPPNVINGFIGTGSGGATPGNRVTAGVGGATIGGGGFNGTLSFPSGGTESGDNSNRVTDWFGTVGGGFNNRAGTDNGNLEDGSYATVGGGGYNTAHFLATVGGGVNNTASGSYAMVGGGDSNTASGSNATVGGGAFNTVSGHFATVSGGDYNSASGNYSFAAGHRAKASHQGAFVWADSTDADFTSTVNNQFLIRAAGGVGIGTNAPDRTLSVNGDASKVGGGMWQVFSDERLKNIRGKFTPGLSALLKLQPIRFEYKADNALGLKATGETIGFSAQAVAAVLPEAVTETASGYLQLNGDPILWTMLNSIKEQQQVIERLQTRLKTVERALARKTRNHR